MCMSSHHFTRYDSVNVGEVCISLAKTTRGKGGDLLHMDATDAEIAETVLFLSLM